MKIDVSSILNVVRGETNRLPDGWSVGFVMDVEIREENRDTIYPYPTDMVDMDMIIKDGIMVLAPLSDTDSSVLPTYLTVLETKKSLYGLDHAVIEIEDEKFLSEHSFDNDRHVEVDMERAYSERKLYVHIGV